MTAKSLYCPLCRCVYDEDTQRWVSRVEYEKVHDGKYRGVICPDDQERAETSIRLSLEDLLVNLHAGKKDMTTK